MFHIRQTISDTIVFISLLRLLLVEALHSLCLLRFNSCFTLLLQFSKNALEPAFQEEPAQVYEEPVYYEPEPEPEPEPEEEFYPVIPPPPVEEKIVSVQTFKIDCMLNAKVVLTLV